ncbi:MAG: transposase [Leptospiraceae bacterium]|nr:transposase [Leptospiraceae bacterium]
MTDGYHEYERIFGMFPLIILANCMAHARRYFEEATIVSENGVKIYSETCKKILELN